MCVCVYIKYDLFFVDNIFKRARAHFFYTQLNDLKYSDRTLTILRQSFVSTMLNGYTFTVILLPRDLVLYILPFGLVRLRAFRLAHGLVRCNINAGVHARAERMCHSEMS